nr:MAG TPA: hypothetical protein [Caudoviricetes sp.]
MLPLSPFNHLFLLKNQYSTNDIFVRLYIIYFHTTQ